jgi:hypothetical protein
MPSALNMASAEAGVEAESATHSGLVRPAGARVVRPVADALADDPVRAILERVRAEDGQQRFVERQVDHLPSARNPIPVMERREHGDRARLRGHHVCHGKGREGRRVGGTGRRGEARHGLHHGAEARPVAIWPVLPPTRDAHHDQARVGQRERVPAESPLLERAGDVIFDQDVRGPGEALEEGLAFGRRQVERDRALAAPVNLPPELTERLRPGANGVAAPGVLDLEDIGAEVGQHGGQHAAGDEARAVHHAEVGERPRR